MGQGKDSPVWLLTESDLLKYTDRVLCIVKSLLLTFKLWSSCRDGAEREAPMFWSDLDLESGDFS